MDKVILLIAMLFFHIIDDYYLQGWLASAKQKRWWEENAPDPLYKNDYIMALAEHAFSWTCMINIPILIYLYVFEVKLSLFWFLYSFLLNWATHAVVDHQKANLHKINLIQDQVLHFAQIIATWGINIGA